MAQISSRKCDICETETGKLYCYECRHFLCDPCKRYHDKFQKKHTTADSHNVDRLTLSQQLTCEQHKEDFVHFCSSCECLTCSLCDTSAHQGHSLTQISEVVSQARENVKHLIDRLKKKIKTLTEFIEPIKTTKLQKLKSENEQYSSEVETTSEQIISIVKAVRDINMTRASDFLVLEKQQLEFTIAKLEKIYNEHTSLSSKLEQVLQLKHDVAFFLYQKSITKQIRDLDDIPRTIEKPNEIGQFNTGEFVKFVVEQIQSQYNMEQLELKKTEMSKLERENEDLKKKLEQQNRVSNKLTSEREKTILDIKQQSGPDFDKMLSEDNERLLKENHQLKIDTSEQKAEIDRLRLSLSKVAGERMVEGNPFLSDLSDKNRPQKLTDKFNSLYDNSWTDAYEIIASKNEDEKDVCLKFLDIFQNCWTFCLNYSAKQLEDLQMSLLYPDIKDEEQKKQLLKDYPSENTKLIKDTRRCFAEKFLPNLHKHYWDQRDDKDVERSVQPYVEACLEFCWYSAITDPPLAYLFDAKQNQNDFRRLTQSGDIIDHVVWPAMYLYEYGPLLYKGVVQYKN